MLTITSTRLPFLRAGAQALAFQAGAQLVRVFVGLERRHLKYVVKLGACIDRGWLCGLRPVLRRLALCGLSILVGAGLDAQAARLLPESCENG